MGKRRKKKTSWIHRRAQEMRTSWSDIELVETSWLLIITMLICIGLVTVLTVIYFDSPISGETTRRNLDLNLYVNGHIIHDGYISVHQDGTYSFTCFLENGERVNMTVPASSCDIQALPASEEKEGVFNVTILETEIVGKLTGRHIGTASTYTIFIPDNAYAIEYE